MKLLTSKKLKKHRCTMRYKHLKPKHFVSLIMLLIANCAVFAQELSDTKYITRSFSVNRETNIEVSNKYGMVSIETWNSDSVKFVISATARASTSVDVASSLNNIDFQFINTDHYVIAKTLFLNPSRAIINDLKSIFSKSNGMNIDYKIYVPKTVNLKIENKFGDIYANTLAGSISLILSYGKLKVYQVDGQLNLNLNYVDNAEIEKMTRGNCDISFSNILIKQTATLDLNSNFSKIDINEIDDIQAESTNDEINIIELKNGDINSKFSKINIGYLSNSFIGDSKFGTITFKKLASDFSKINIGTKYSDVNVYFDANLIGFNLEISNQKSRIMYPRIYNLKEELINQKESIYRTSGHIGKASNSRIYVDANHGNINIKTK